MALMETLYFIFLLSFAETTVYLYHTEDSLSAEFYDCVYHNDLLYCRRPSTPIVLQRDSHIQRCYHNGKVHSFASIINDSIDVSFILHNWNSGIEMVEDYLNRFGKDCEYRLLLGETFEEELIREQIKKKRDPDELQVYGDILCYETLRCDSGLLCLDWRDICDGVQQCMLGYDEENCDKLEFNECEDGEYRCVNGMCIPDEYFLDGDYDCMDMTDEMGYDDGSDCALQQVNSGCDDRICLRNHYSCGDGQCILDRLAFQKSLKKRKTCKSYREQYYMCETHSSQMLWTLPNGKCSSEKNYEEINVLNRTNSELCIYFLKCALSEGAEKNCVSRSNGKDYVGQLRRHCHSSSIQYPTGAIIAPYLRHFYNIERLWENDTPDFIALNATIRCRQYLIQHYAHMSYSMNTSLRQWEELICTSQVENISVLEVGNDEPCYNDSQTFTGQSYNVIDVCNRSRECISAYRIADGSADCADQMDEAEDNRILVLQTCFTMRRHRFRCSPKQLTCLPINRFDNYIADCKNNHDEIFPSRPKYYSRSNNDREMLRQYIENSWKADSAFQVVEHMSFQGYCNTFWDEKSQKDEDSSICKDWWICSEDQWQCHSGQCIDIDWILDGEWDCSDASDEQAIFFTNHSLSSHNFDLINGSILEENFAILYDDEPFWNICSLDTEFPCFPTNSSHLLTDTGKIHPCINLEKVGDGHADCLGALDERNTIEHCNGGSMLGYDFQCLSTKTCIEFFQVCITRCPNTADDKQVCTGITDSDNCRSYNDFRCWNGTCIRKGWCNGDLECLHGEDEYFCQIPSVENEIIELSYRSHKKMLDLTIPKELNLPVFPYAANISDNITGNNPTILKSINIINNISSSMPYVCNRGVGILTYKDSVVCFCPEQYYGDKCQFYSDQFSAIFSLNISNSKYIMNTNAAVVLKMLVLFLYRNQSLGIKEFHVRPGVELTNPTKQILRFLYPRTNASLERKRKRRSNRSDIIYEHPYSVQIEGYELKQNETPFLIGVWKYPIYFDYLPSFRLAKILSLTNADGLYDPCSSNPCNKHYKCYPLLNQPRNYICSSSEHESYANYCASNALYRRDIRLPAYCICPLERYGRRCELLHDQCNENPCENNGTCLPSIKPTEYYCICTDLYYGKQCELPKQIISLRINNTAEYRAIVIQYFQINVTTLNLILISQHVYTRLPSRLTNLLSELKPPDLIVAKQYIDINQVHIYIISIQINGTSISITTHMSEINRCVDVRSLFPETEREIHAYKYHRLCRKNSTLFCFYDPNYLCICDKDHYRVECFGYNHNIERCSFCFANGQCLIEDRRHRENYLCLCPRCHSGRLCQFTDDGLSFTLHSALLRVDYAYQIIYCSVVFLIFIFGAITNCATFITFNRSNLRSTSVGIYLLFYAMISQLTLLSLLLKSLQVLLDFLIDDTLCKIISYLLSITLRCSLWLISWVAIVRVVYIRVLFSTLFKNVYLAVKISFMTLIIVASMDIHELFFYVKDPSGQSACIAHYPSIVSMYERVTVILHHTIPFCIQILSITGLIILAARSRSRATNNSETFSRYLQRQFQIQKEMYIVPLVVIISGLPQSIFSFSFSCIELSSWQKHLLILAYLFAYAPQSLGFILFVLPSSSYLKEFQATSLSKTFIFRFILTELKKNHLVPTTTVT
ncbi:unnamed protein product [Adineta ricciae]|uniref:Uncharacterized protein n=3 Tax=Adineta ricciae TaxID=249248 RepID=A0A814UZ04_ADIRI|nr:unnamed protein product [Adineta ricciae]